MIEKLGKSMPAIFTDETWQMANHYILSTSTLSTDTIVLGGFTPMVPDGYGIGYNTGGNRLGYIVSGYPPATDLQDFAECLKASLNDIYQVLQFSRTS